MINDAIINPPIRAVAITMTQNYGGVVVNFEGSLCPSSQSVYEYFTFMPSDCLLSTFHEL